MGSAEAGEQAANGAVKEMLREPNKRLQLAAVLLVVAGVMGFITVGAGTLSSSGVAGLGELLEEPKADVMGQVKDQDGTPIQGAVVTFSKTGSTSTTGASGWYFLEELPTGRVSLRMEAEGYKTVVREFTIERGQYVVDFVTGPGPGEVTDSDEAVPKAGDPDSGTVMLLVAIAATSALAIVGAYVTYLHTLYPLAVTGAFLGLMTFGWFLGSACALVALILILPLRREFRGKPQVPQVPWRASQESGTDLRMDMPPSGEEDPGRPSEDVTRPPERDR